jgi:hypothetical protein
MRYWLAIWLVLVFPAASAACLGGHPSVKAEAHDSRLVIVGKVTGSYQIRDPEDPAGFLATLYVVRVVESIRGQATIPLHVWSVNTSSRYPMEVGEQHLLFLNMSDEGFWEVNSCGNSALFAPGSQGYRVLKQVLRYGP